MEEERFTYCADDAQYEANRRVMHCRGLIILVVVAVEIEAAAANAPHSRTRARHKYKCPFSES